MSSELGKIERPDAEGYRKGRKVYLVPLVFGPRETEPEFARLFERYWREVREQLLKLENSIGSIARVYHEAIGIGEEAGLAAVERLSLESASICRTKVEAGATLEALEDQELVAESFDWQRCMMVGLDSRKVSELAWNSYNEAMRKRYEVMAGRIEETLKDDQAALLFMSEEHRLQFPADIRVFYVAPPSLNDIHRWIRDMRERRDRGAESAVGEEIPVEDSGEPD